MSASPFIVGTTHFAVVMDQDIEEFYVGKATIKSEDSQTDSIGVEYEDGVVGRIEVSEISRVLFQTSGEAIKAAHEYLDNRIRESVAELQEFIDLKERVVDKLNR